MAVPQGSSGGMSATVIIVNKRGLHARASARLAREAGAFASVIKIAKGGTSVTATSIMGLMMLGAAKGDEIIISAEGDDQQTALDALTALVKDRFGEAE